MLLGQFFMVLLLRLSSLTPSKTFFFFFLDDINLLRLIYCFLKQWQSCVNSVFQVIHSLIHLLLESGT